MSHSPEDELGMRASSADEEKMSDVPERVRAAARLALAFEALRCPRTVRS
jgi:hypothetical protein